MNLAETIKRMGKPQESLNESNVGERFQSAEAELAQYARKDGGMDKADFMAVAKMLGQIGRANILNSGQILSKLNRKLSDMDTDPRDKVYSVLKSKGLMEALQEAPEDNEPASPDEGSMAMQQLEFIAYAAEEIEEHIKAGGKFPEWMQNKLATVNDQMQSLHAQIDHEEIEDDEMDEARNPNKSGGTGYDLYHKDFSSAMQHAYKYAKDKLGVEIDPTEIDDKVASGPRKPSKGKTNTYRLKGKDGKKAVQIQVANLDDKKFELNMYKESVELDEAKSKEQQITDLEKMLDRISGNTSSVKMKKFALQKKIDKLKNEEVEVELEESKLEFEGNASNKNLQTLAKKLGVKLAQKGKMVVATGGRSALDKMEIELDLDESVEIEEAKYQVDIKGAGRETVMAKNEREAIAKASKKMKVHSFKTPDVTVKLIEDADVNEAFESLFETYSFGGIQHSKSILDSIMSVVSEKKELDPVNKKAVKKDFDDRKDKDIDNDGDVDDSDEYLHKRRQAVSKAVSSDKAEAENDKEISDKEDEPKGKVGKSNKQTKVDVNPSIEEEKGEPMTSAEMEKRDEIMKSLEKRKSEFEKKYGDRAKEVMARTAIKMAKKHA